MCLENSLVQTTFLKGQTQAKTGVGGEPTPQAALKVG